MHKNSNHEATLQSEGQYLHLFDDNENKKIWDHEKKKETFSVGDKQREASDAPINTSDEEQEELPYDGSFDSHFYRRSDDWNFWDPADTSEDCLDLKSLELNQSLRKESAVEKQDMTETGVVGVRSSITSSSTFPRTDNPSTYKESTLTSDKNLAAEVFPSGAILTDHPNSGIPDVLLRHFYQDPELNSSQFIDSETIPDTSFVESSDETIISRISNSKSEFTREEDEHFEALLLKCQDASSDFNPNVETERTDDDLIADEAGNPTNDLKFVNKSVTHETENEIFESQLDFEMIEKQSNYGEYRFERRTSSQEVKYGQGQVHYRLPDFSKIPPKVKIPQKTGDTKPFPAIKRARSSPNLIGRSSVVKDILEDMPSGVIAETTKVEQETIDEMNRLQVLSNWDSYKPTLGGHSRAISTHPEGSATMNSSRPSSGAREERLPLETRGLRNQTEGERMSEMLKAQSEQFKIKVLQHLKGCLDTLEQNYLSTKEKHRQLQLRYYNSSSESIGVFDPDRLVESDIFRLGMLLEDIKERIDENLCNPSASLSSVSPDLISPPESICSSHASANELPKTVEFKREEELKEIPLNEGPNTAKTIEATVEQDQNSQTDNRHQPSTHINKGMECKDVSTVQAVMGTADNVRLQEGTPSPEESVCWTSTVTNCETEGQETQANPLDEDSHLDLGGPGGHDEIGRTDTAAAVTRKTESFDSERWLEKNPPSAKELQDHVVTSAAEAVHHIQETHRKPLGQDPGFHQDATKGCSPFLEVSSPTKIKTYGSHNWGHNTVSLNVMDEGRSFTKALDPCLQNGTDFLELSPKQYISNAQLVRKQEENEHCSTVYRPKNTSDRTFSGRRSKQRRIEIVIKQEAANLDPTETDLSSAVDDSTFSDLSDAASRRKLLAQSAGCYKLPSKGHVYRSTGYTHSTLTGFKEEYTGQNNGTDFNDFFLSCALSRRRTAINDLKSGIDVISRIPAYSPRKMIYAPAMQTSKYKSDLGHRILERKNFVMPKTYYSSIYDTVMLSPQYIQKGLYGRRTLFRTGQSHFENVDSMILNSILDQAIQTAKSMKKTTERMVQTVSADLAKVQSQRGLHQALQSRHALS